VDKQTWDAAQRVGAERGNTRDAEMPTTQPGRRYILRSRIRCRICQRRMCGTTSTAPSYYKTEPGNTYAYYRCPHTRANPRHAAAHPDHPPVGVREDTLISALAGFFTERVFGPDRATMLTTQLPASAADEAARRQAHAAALRKQLAKIDTAEHALITELEAPAAPGDPAAQALRGRIRARFAELYSDRTRIEAELTGLDSATTRDNDPSLLDELPMLGDILTGAPPRLLETLLGASTSRPSTTRTCTSSPSGPPSPTPPPTPSPACSPTPAPTTTPTHPPTPRRPGRSPARTVFHTWTTTPCGGEHHMI
jgi:hypothetical protein